MMQYHVLATVFNIVAAVLERSWIFQRGTMNQITSICVEYKHVDDGSEAWHVFTSEQITGLFVVSKDPETAYNDVATSIALLLRLNEGVKCRVRPELTFNEFLNAARLASSEVSGKKKKQDAPTRLSNTRYAVQMAA